MHKVVIVEDDPRSAMRLRGFIASYGGADALEVTTCTSAAELDKHIAHHGMPDVTFVSIELGGGTEGVDLVAERFPYGCATKVVYLSGNLSHVPEAYCTQHAYLLAKPVTQARVHDAIDKALFGVVMGQDAPLLVKSAGSIVSVQPGQIVYVESDRRKVRVHTTRTVLESYSSLGDVATALPGNFTQCHKSFLVNLAYVAELDKTDILTTTGEKIPVSQRRRKTTIEALTNSMRML